jgi:leucyl-tRNA synthetase
MAGVNGVRGFLDRAWRMIIDDRSEEIQLNPAVQDVDPDEAQARVLHRTIKVVTQDLEKMHLNTAIARMMEFVNFFTKQPKRPRSAMNQFVLLLSPYAPHIAEELWQALGHDSSLAYVSWPDYDESRMMESSVEIPVQINGKLKSRTTVSIDCSKEDLEKTARSDEKIVPLLEGKQIVKTVVVPGRMVNFVVR